MIAMPAIDIRDGACVQLVGGSYADERVRLPDPAAVAMRWRDAGFTQLHLVDLDAGTGHGSNSHVVQQLLSEATVEVQVGGGVRSDAAVDALLQQGATRVVVGTRALEDPAWTARLAARLPHRIVVAADVRAGRPVVSGWTRDAGVALDDLLDQMSELPLAGVLVTAVDVEGRMTGPDLALIDRVLTRVAVPVIASGGIATMDDLCALRDRGVWAAVIGMALYTDKLDPTHVAMEFGR